MRGVYFSLLFVVIFLIRTSSGTTAETTHDDDGGQMGEGLLGLLGKKNISSADPGPVDEEHTGRDLTFLLCHWRNNLFKTEERLDSLLQEIHILFRLLSIAWKELQLMFFI